MIIAEILLLASAAWLIVGAITDTKKQKIAYKRDMQKLREMKKAEFAELNRLLNEIKDR